MKELGSDSAHPHRSKSQGKIFEIFRNDVLFSATHRDALLIAFVSIALERELLSKG